MANDKNLEEALSPQLWNDPTFVATVSHAVRNPLVSLLGMAELMGQTRLSDQQKFYLRTIKAQALQLRAVTGDLLDLAQLQGDAFQLHLQPFDPWRLCHELTDAFGVQAETLDIKLRFEQPAPTVPRYVIGDRGRIEQVLSGMLTVMLRQAFFHHIIVELIHLDEPPSGVGDAPVFGNLAWLGFVVRASAPECIPQPDTQTWQLTRAIAARLGGTLNLKHDVDGDWCMAFEAPLAVLEAPQRKQRNEKAQRSGWVLIADDHRANQVLLEHLLRQHGMTVKVTADGSQALHEAMRQRYDVILLDVDMPHKNGFDAAHAIRAHAASTGQPRTPILALTAHVSETAKDACLAAGMDGFLPKPIAHERFVDTVRAWVERRPLVLVVDEQPLRRERVVADLEDSGRFRVLVARHAEDARAHMQHWPLPVMLVASDLPIDDLASLALASKGEAGHLLSTRLVALGTLHAAQHAALDLTVHFDAQVDADASPHTLVETLCGVLHLPTDASEPSQGASAESDQVPDVVRDLLPGYLINRVKDVQILRTALSEGDFDNIARLGHKLKGSGASYGLSLISALGNRLETSARNASATEIEAAIGELEHFLESVEQRPQP